MTPDDTSVQVLILWALALSTFVNLATVVWNIFSGPSKKNGVRLDSLTVEVTAIGQRVSMMDQQQQSGPSKKDVHELELTMMRLSGALDVMNVKLSSHGEIMERVEATVSRHEEHLLRKS
ncbi:MAG: hypothetical protein JWS10_948 [Cypionkella sp.]|uniref:DUF2730 family protein n=1 Tax=Cypionkella sp. TaxID=2811411 RepID=UPI00261E24AC|nr:DUF2730 family protein [Cypionkella sp.]MDB5658333.1 hypothetical protein [Cypionkella sp.]